MIAHDPGSPAVREARRFLGSLRPEQIGTALFQHLPDVYLFVKDRRSRFMTVNRSEVEFLGAPAEDQVLGRTDYDFFSSDFAGRYVGGDREILATGRSFENSVGVIPNNRTLELEWHIGCKVPLYDRHGRIAGVAGFTRRIAECEQPAIRDERLWKAASLARRNYAEGVSVPDMAGEAGLPLRTFTRRFAQSFDLSPADYIRSVRLNAACRALARTGDPLVQVALDCGYCDQSHMTAEFRARLGTTPADYRRRWR
jgi:AraC-like DNA-binding protein